MVNVLVKMDLLVDGKMVLVMTIVHVVELSQEEEEEEYMMVFDLHSLLK